MTALLLVAHGTRDPAGPREIGRMADAVADRLPEVDVRVGYVDVIGPAVADVLRATSGPVVVVPAFLASGYHVRTDLPSQINASGRGAEVSVSPALGPDAAVTEAMWERLKAAGWKRGDRVVFSAAGSSDSHALAEVRAASHSLGRRCGQTLSPSYVGTARPLTAERCDGSGRTFVAPYLLAPGLFHRRLVDLPVTAVADPIGAHPHVVDLIVGRYRAARDKRVYAA